MLKYVLLIVGFVLLIKGADFFVDGASNIAKKFNISPLIIGLTIVAFGTSLPEASVSISAALAGSNQLCLSNVVGSNIFNLLVVVGACVLFKSMAVDDQVLKRDFPITIFATFVLWFMSINMFDKNVPGTIKTYEGLILFILFLAYMIYTVIDAKKNVKPLTEEEKEANKKINIIKNLVLLIIGLCGIVFGGNLVVDSATKIAISFGVSEAFVGLTIVAMGTSLPELVTSLVALGKGSTDIAIGNVIGSNLFNILFILGASTALSSVNVEEGLETDIIFLLLVSVVSYVFGLTDKKITRFEGVAMLLCYFGYIVFMLQRAGLINIF